MNIVGYQVTDNAKRVETIVRSWCNSFITFSEVTGTVPHQSKPEQTNVGIFCSTAWRSGWVAFQEVACHKKDIGDGEGYGYCDIWLKNFSGTGTAYYVECKGRIVEKKSQAEELLKIAIEDTARLKIEETEKDDTTLLALAFCNIQFYGCYSKEAIHSRIFDIINEIKEIDTDIFAYCFPEKVLDYNDNKYYMPGVILLGKLQEPY